ncbi:hypothetical protein GQ42DRAFT_158977 [Ramicandelaber brevisporus]|nr:hypothetical protein GQ42DRAFT_158977 [Ramicandelaber brevisporus]
MPSFISRLFTSFSQFVKSGEKNAHDISDSYSVVTNPCGSEVSATSYYNRVFPILLPELFYPMRKFNTNCSLETCPYDRVSILVGDSDSETPPPTTTEDLMEAINELSIILTSQHDISKLKWAHPKFMNQKHCGSFLDTTSVALLLLHYGIEQDSNGVYVNRCGDITASNQSHAPTGNNYR